MNILFSSTQIETLLPALKYIAESVQNKETISGKKLQLLLDNIGLREEWMTGELERWVKVLLVVRGVKDKRKKEIAQRSLMLRGVSEGAAKLIIDTAAGEFGSFHG